MTGNRRISSLDRLTSFRHNLGFQFPLIPRPGLSIFPEVFAYQVFSNGIFGSSMLLQNQRQLVDDRDPTLLLRSPRTHLAPNVLYTRVAEKAGATSASHNGGAKHGAKRHSPALPSLIVVSLRTDAGNTACVTIASNLTDRTDESMQAQMDHCYEGVDSRGDLRLETAVTLSLTALMLVLACWEGLVRTPA